jgi:membrane protein EpsK
MNLGLALLLAGPVGWGMYGVAAAGAIMLTVKNFIFTPLYAAHILGLGYSTFYRETIPIILATFGLTSLGWGVSYYFPNLHWMGLIGAGMALTCVYVAFSSILLLTKGERAAALRIIWPQWQNN